MAFQKLLAMLQPLNIFEQNVFTVRKKVQHFGDLNP